MTFQHADLCWTKGGGLLPAIVQDADSARVLMLGYMNQAALEQTLATRRVTFFSRSRQRLWVKGETSGHGLELVDLATDCDRDCLLLLARPQGPCCHRGTQSCFDPLAPALAGELALLDQTIALRLRELPEGSYTTELAGSGVLRVAQKVGEEGVEVALAGAAQSATALVAECADLLYHLGVLLALRGESLASVLGALRQRREHK